MAGALLFGYTSAEDERTLADLLYWLQASQCTEVRGLSLRGWKCTSESAVVTGVAAFWRGLRL